MKKFAILFILLISAISLSAQTSRTWTGSTSTDWNTAANWSPSGVPSSSDHVVLNNGSLTNMPLLDANRSITNITVTAGAMNLNGYILTVTGTTSLTGGAINNGKVTFANSTTSIAGTTFGAVVSITASTVSLSNSTFNSKVTIAKTGSSSDGGGGNTYNDTLDIRLQNGSLGMATTGNDAYNGDVYVSNTASGFITLGSSGSYGCTLASGKKMYVGSAGFNSGQLYLRKFTQSGTTPQSITLGGTTSQLIILNSSVFNGTLAAQAPVVNIGASTFNKKVTIVKTGSLADTYTGGNTFNDTLDITTQAGGIIMAGSGNDVYNGNVYVSNTGTSFIALGSSGSFGCTLALGKKVLVGSGGFNSGQLYLRKFTQTGTTRQSITLGGTSTQLFINNSSVFNAAIDIQVPTLSLENSTFNKKVSIVKTGASNDTYTGGNTFNDTLSIALQAGGIIMASSANDSYNGDVYVSNTGSGFLALGSSGSYGGTLATGKKLIIGSAGFNSGILYLRRFTQSGTTAQSFSLGGTTTQLIINNASIFNGNLTLTVPNVLIEGATFHGALSVTKNSSSSNIWTVANTYNGNVSITNTGSGYINMSNVGGGGDVYNANATFTKSSAGDIIIAGNSSMVTFKGNVTLNNISSTQFSGSQGALFNGTAAQTLNQSSSTLNFGRVTINKASNNLTLNAPLTISTALTLTSGRIITTGTNLLNLADNATVSSASNSSYVQGPMSKTGNDAFTFPTGKAGNYRPIGISAPSSTATIFTAEYVDANQTLGTSADTSIANLSDCEHWTLTRSGSTSNVNVTLPWNSASCNGAVATNMRVAGWNGTAWTNYGNGARTGNATAGTVTSNTNPTAYNAFTLSNKNCTGVATITPSGSTTACSGLLTLTAKASKYYLWSNDANVQVITPTNTGTYTVTLRDTSGCKGTANQAVIIRPVPIANAGPDTLYFPYHTGIMGYHPAATGGTSPYTYDWTPGLGLSDSTVANPIVRDTLSITLYNLKVTDTHGCTSTDNVRNVWEDPYGPDITVVSPCANDPGNVTFCVQESNNAAGFYWDITGIPSSDCPNIMTIGIGEPIGFCFTCTITTPGTYTAEFYTNQTGTPQLGYTETFTIIGPPEITDLIIDPTPICYDSETGFGTADFTVTGNFLYSGSPYGVSIDYGDGNNDVDYNAPFEFNHDYGLPGTYSITVTTSSPCGEDEETYTVNVWESCCFGPNPEANTDISFGSGITLASDILANPGGIYSSILGVGNGPGNLVLTTNYTGTPNTELINTPTISINGTFIVDIANVTFDAAHITLGTNARIEFSQVGMSLKTLNINDSWLHACDNLWDGIYVRSNNINTPTRVVNVNFSLIEDAINAIVSERCGDYNIVDSRFNKNYKHIVVQKCTGYVHPSEVTGTIFECDATLALASPALPGNPTRTNICIEANEQLLLRVGSSSSSLNYFHQSNIGIYGNISSLTLKNNTFEDYKGFAHNTTPGNLIQTQGNLLTAKMGTAVYAFGSGKRTTGLNVLGNGLGNTGDNIFIDCTRGVFAYNNINVSIIGNQFDNGFNAVYIWHCVNNSILIRKNDFDFSVSPPIGTAKHGVIVNNFRFSAVNINQNTMVFNQTSTSGIAAYHGTGITVRETNLPPVSLAFRNNVKIFKNKITEAQIGIRIINTTGKGGFVPPDVEIHSNRIDVYQNPSATNTMRYGIFNQNTRYTYIRSNWVSSDFSNDALTEGIRNQSSTGTEVYCNYLNLDNTTNNTVNLLGNAITFNNASNNSHFFRNQMQNAESGIRLALSANTENQINPNRAQDNQWFSDVVDFPLGTIYSDRTEDAGRKIYVWPGSNSTYDPTTLGGITANPGLTPPSSPFDNPIIMDINNPNIRSYDCVEQTWGTDHDADYSGLRTMARRIAADSVSYPCFATGTRYSEKTFVYNLIKEYPDSMLVDSTVNSFYTTNAIGNMGILWTVDSLLASYMVNLDSLSTDSIFEPKDSADYYVHRFDIDTATVDLAETTLLTVTPANRIEQSNYTVNMAVIHALQRSINPDSAYTDENIYSLAFSDAEWDSLNVYAYLCAYEYGPVVYKARILLSAVGDSLQEFWESYINPCEVGDTIWARHTINVTENNNLPVKLYPNPTTGNIFVQLPEGIERGTIQLFSANGSVLQSQTINNHLMELDLGKYANGLYILRIFDNSGKFIAAKKVSLQR